MRSNTFDTKSNMNKYPDKPNSDKDFQTYSVQSKMSYQKQPQNTNTTVSNNQKITKSIIQAIKKIFKDNEKIIVSSALKPTQKSLITTISAFLNSFDNTFDQSTLTIQMIPQIFKALGYPNTISKTYFQPVGAPHTWGQCLAMMEWLADLASFHHEMREILEEEQGQKEDFTSMLIRSYTENDASIVKRYLDAEIDRKAKAIQDFKYNINTMNMEIENQKAAQKSLKELDEEQKILEQILYRQTQEAIQIQHQNTELDKKLRDIRNRVKQQEMLNQIHQNQIQSLTKEVQNQELSVEQVEKIKYQIKETRQKITQLRKFEQRQKQILDRTDENIINDYLEFNKTLEALRHMYRKHKYEMDLRNIYMDIPECDVTKFREFLKNRTEQCTDPAAEEILGINQIKDLTQKADTLLNIVDQEMKSLDESKQLISVENQKLNEQCLQKQMQNTEQEMKLSSMKSKMNGIQYEIQSVQIQINQLKTCIKAFENNIQSLQEEENVTLDVAQRFIRDITEWGEINKTLKPQVDQTVEKIAMELIDLKVEIIQKVSEIAETIQEFNEDMAFSQFVQSRNQRKMNKQNSGHNEGQRVEQDSAGGEGAREDEVKDGIEVVRGNHGSNADDDYDYMILFGQGVYQSPKPDKVNRMLQKGYKP